MGGKQEKFYGGVRGGRDSAGGAEWIGACGGARLARALVPNRRECNVHSEAMGGEGITGKHRKRAAGTRNHEC